MSIKPDEAMQAFFTEARELLGRVLLEVGGNTLRRTRGGKKAVFENLWPKLRKVVCADYRMSQTALHADIVLPAAQHYEKTAFGMPGPYTMFLSLGEAAVPPYAEARAEWEMLGALCKKIAARAEARGLEGYVLGFGRIRMWARPLLVLSGLLFAYPDPWKSALLGAVLLLLTLLTEWAACRRKGNKTTLARMDT